MESTDLNSLYFFSHTRPLLFLIGEFIRPFQLLSIQQEWLTTYDYAFYPENSIYLSWFITLSVQRTADMRWSYQSGMCKTYVSAEPLVDVEVVP